MNALMKAIVQGCCAICLLLTIALLVNTLSMDVPLLTRILGWLGGGQTAVAETDENGQPLPESDSADGRIPDQVIDATVPENSLRAPGRKQVDTDLPTQFLMPPDSNVPAPLPEQRHFQRKNNNPPVYIPGTDLDQYDAPLPDEERIPTWSGGAIGGPTAEESLEYLLRD